MSQERTRNRISRLAVMAAIVAATLVSSGRTFDADAQAAPQAGPAATQLAFIGQPSNGVSGIALAQQPVVQVRDSNGVVVSDSNAPITLQLVAPPSVQAPPVPAEAQSRQPLKGKDSLLPYFLESSTPTNQWAAWLVPGSNPQDIATDLGAVYVQPATPIENAYIFEFPSAVGFADPAVVAALESSTAVYQYEQQVITPSTSRTVPTEEGFENQWHLKNTGQDGRTPGIDINVEPAWTSGFTGTGVTIGIIDDGLQVDHPDLAPNYSALLSHDYFDDDADPSPGEDDHHGTSVAGLAGGAANNGVCGVGSAYNALLAGIRGGGKDVSTVNEALMLSHMPQDIDIYNNSWGPSDNGAIHAIPTGSLAAINAGITSGRGGLGNIYVWAGGNGRANNDDVNYDGFANLRQVIAIGAIEGDGTVSPYSEPGASLLVVVPGGTTEGDIYTTDRSGNAGPDGGYDNGDCTPGFNGTSAATPIVSGAIALMLQANPTLTYRDVQHILVNSTTKNDPGNADWTTNGAGHWINHDYGFGLLDTAAAVALAEDWVVHVHPENSATSGLQAVLADIPNNSEAGITRTVTMPGNLRLEHVELVFNATHPFRGDLDITLTSPAGTVSKLAQHRVQDGGIDYVNWKFTSTRYWDESMAGTWKVTVADRSEQDMGSWQNFTLNFYGTIPTTGLVCEGSLTRVPISGNASFVGCKVTTPGDGYTLRALSPGLATATSQPFNITDPGYDATCNGVVSADDALAALNLLAGLGGGPTFPCNGDADHSNILTLTDVVLIRRRAAGLE